MLLIRRNYQFKNCLTAWYNSNGLHGRNWTSVLHIQTCKYTKKSAEEMLGIEKPKRPLNPFFKFMVQMRPALNAKIPGISSKETIVWSSKHWQLLDHETKSQIKKEYENDMETFRQKMLLYKSSLTDNQKDDIKRVNKEIIVSRDKRKLKSEIKQMGKPKKPMSSYILYAQSRKDAFQRNLKEFQKAIKAGWQNLTDSERAKYDKEAQDLMKKYKEDMEKWELKMISMGHLHLVRKKPEKPKKKPKNVNKI